MAPRTTKKAPAKRRTPSGQLPIPGGTPSSAGFTLGSVAAVGGQTTNPGSTYENYPLNDLSPSQQPAAWGITDTNAQLYVGSKSQDVPLSSSLRFNRLLGDIGDRIGVKGGASTDSVTAALAKYTGVSGADLAGKSESTLEAVANKLGISPKIKGDSLYSAIADKLGIDVTGSSKITNDPKYMGILDVAASIYNMSSSQIDALQTQLYDAGYYDQNIYTAASTAAAKITPGNLDPYTMKAWGTFLQSVAASKKNVTWSTTLTQESGADAKSQGTTGQDIDSLIGASLPKVNEATAGQLLDPLRSAFESMLGRLPTDAELQQFVTQYDTSQAANSSKIAPGTILFPDSDTGVDIEPGVPRPTYAAEAMAQSDNTEYQAHQMANAGALLLNAMRGGSGLGTEPNVTNAG